MDTNNNLTQEQVDYEVSQFEQSPDSSLGMNFEFYSPFRVDAKNMSETSWENFLEKVNSLSVPIKNTLTDISTVEFLITVAEDFDFTDEQSTNLSRLVRDILVGDLLINDLTLAIIQKLILDQDLAKQIRNKITNDLLTPITEDIKKIQTTRTPERTDRPTMPPQPQVPKPSERPDLKIEPNINRNNIVDLRNK